MFNSTILDVAISLIFVFLLFSLLCSAIKELIAAWLNLRGRMLVKGITSLLGGLSSNYKLPLPLPRTDMSTQEFIAAVTSINSPQPVAKRLLESEVVSAQSSPGLFGKDRLPSYLSDTDFAAALLHTLFGTQGIGSRPLGAVKTFFENSSLSEQAKAPLLTFLNQIDRGKETLQENIEKWYNDGMDRVSGWYKRQSQWILLAISFGVVISFNVDAIELTKRIYRDTPLRASIVTSTSLPVETDPSVQGQYNQVHERIEALELPIGWNSPVDITSVDFWQQIPGKIPGLLLTTLALSLGAPFWFDILNKIMNLRISGKKPTKSAGAI